jgi:hypothetical protein
MIIRSSATACPPDISGFERADTLRKELLNAALKGDLSAMFSTCMEQVRNRIAALLHLDRIDPFPAIITTPSGIEAELVLVQLAVERWRELAQKEKPNQDVQPAVENVFISADEIGSDKQAAGAMQPFSAQAPDGSDVTSAFVDGVSRAASGVVTFSKPDWVYQIRSDCQGFATQLEHRLNEIVYTQGRVAIVHIWAASAVGLSFPAPEFLVRIKKKYRERLIAVVDATQMRCDERMLAAFLESGCCVILSGSNFIGGPPFSGALILPFAEAQTLQDAVNKLGHYISAEDVDPRLADFRKSLPDWKNFGLLLRWHAALAIMERYYSLEPKQRQDLVARWRLGVLERIVRIPYLRVYQAEDSLRSFGRCHHWVEHDTIVPVSVCPAESTMGEPEASLDQSGLMQVYQWLADDMSTRLPLQADTTARSIAARPCLTGRPLRIGLDDSARAVLPIAISAADLLRCARGESEFAKVLEEDCLLVRKLGLLAKYFEHLNH